MWKRRKRRQRINDTGNSTEQGVVPLMDTVVNNQLHPSGHSGEPEKYSILPQAGRSHKPTGCVLLHNLASDVKTCYYSLL